jgi:protein-tyrosine phosphatase
MHAPSPKLPPSKLAPAQAARVNRYGVVRSVDIHCHCLPALDDGPQSIEDALALCRALVMDGITDAIATPHQLGRYDGVNWADEVRMAVRRMQALLRDQRIPLTIYPGAEVRIDERIPQLLQEGRLLTLADAGEFILIELPISMPIGARAVRELIGDWPTVVLAHAERYDVLKRDPAGAEAWIEANMALQVNAASLLPDAPPDCRAAAVTWLEMGWVSLIASDAHSTNARRPRMTEALAFLEHQFGPQIAAKICLDNPARLLAGAHGEG